MKLFDIALKDMLRSYRSAIGLVFMFVVPLLVTGLFFLMFGGQADSGGFDLPRTRVVIANMDRNAPRLQAGSKNIPGDIRANTLSELVVAVLQSEEMAELVEVATVDDELIAHQAVDSQQYDVAVIIPEGFSRRFADLNKKTEIEFYQDPTLTLGPQVVRSILSQFMDNLSGVKIAIDVALDELVASDYHLIGEVIQQYLQASSMRGDDLSAELLDEQNPHPTQGEKSPLTNIITPIMGGMMVFYAFYTGTASAQSILREEEERTLPRLFTTPTSMSTILGGKFLAVFLTVAIQIIVLLIVARLIFQVHWGAIDSLFMFALGVVISASSFGIFVNSFMKNTKQGGVVFGAVLTISGMLGMISIFMLNSPAAARLGNSVSLLVPQGWAARGLLMMVGGQPLFDILLNTFVLFLWSLAFFTIGVWRFNQRYG